MRKQKAGMLSYCICWVWFIHLVTCVLNCTKEGWESWPVLGLIALAWVWEKRYRFVLHCHWSWGLRNLCSSLPCRDQVWGLQLLHPPQGSIRGPLRRERRRQIPFPKTVKLIITSRWQLVRCNVGWEDWHYFKLKSIMLIHICSPCAGQVH